MAESFAVSRLLVLCPAIPEHDVSSWKNRLTTWRRHGAVDLSSYERWSALMGYAEVRNAMLHGLGRLTDQQLGKRRQQILVQIRRLESPPQRTDRDACRGRLGGLR